MPRSDTPSRLGINRKRLNNRQGNDCHFLALSLEACGTVREELVYRYQI